MSHPPQLFGTQTANRVRAQYLQQNNEKNKKLTTGVSKKHWGRKKRTKKESIFRQWLLDNFGRKLLGKDSKFGILDIAGGKGVLSFEFCNLNGIKSTVCDPRESLNLKRCTRAMRGGYLHRNKLIAQKYVDCSLEECLSKTDEQLAPEHLRLFFDEKLINFLDGDDDADGGMDDLMAYQLKQFKKFNQDESEYRLGDIELKQRIRRDCVRMLDLMRNCSVVIGMHPDYATEFIVDFALKYKKAFAVLPCCVFPKSFPNRRLNGRAVRQYDDFCDYLTQKHEEISQCVLTLMNGQNKVIYWIPNVEDDRSEVCQLIDDLVRVYDN